MDEPGVLMLMPFASYCKNTECQVLIYPDELVYKVAPGEYVHQRCPDSKIRVFASHKQPNTGMSMAVKGG